MKRLLLLFALCSTLHVFSTNVQAQGYFNHPQEGQVKFGVRGGVNYFNMGTLAAIEDEDYGGFGFIDDVTFKTKNKVGFQIGAFADIWMSPIFSFMPEINVIRKGATLDEKISIKISDPDDPDNIIFSLDLPFKLNTDVYYVEAPLLLGVRPVPSLTLFAGPQLSYLVFQKSSLSGSGEMEDDEFIGTEGLEKFLVGGAAGAQFNVTPNININARYSMDFQSAFKKDQEVPKMKNSGISLSLGYSF